MIDPGARPASVEVRLVGFVLVVMGGAMALSAALGALEGGDDWEVLLGSAAVVGLPGLALYTSFRRPEQILTGSLASSLALGWSAATVSGAVPYVLAGTFPGPWRALFESTMGVTTTAFSLVDDPEALGRSLVVWRSMAQWIGGVGTLVVVLAIIPVLGYSGGRMRQEDPPTKVTAAFLGRVLRGIRPIAAVYGAFTVVVAVAYAVAGLGWVEALNLSLTTVSTGGMAPRSGSLAAYDSAAVEWVAAAAMLVAGGSFARYLGVLRRERRRATTLELRVYLGAVAVGTAVTVAGSGLALSHDSIRQALATVASAITTTGFIVVDQPAWAAGVPMMLLVFTAVGAMSASPSGGFRLARLLPLLAYLREELRAQTRPRRVMVVRTGETVVPAYHLRRLIGHQALYALTATLSAGLIAAGGTDVMTAISGAISAVANSGFALGDLGLTGAVSGLNDLALAGIAFGAFIGRTEVFPSVVLAARAVAGTASARRRIRWPR